jgi:hypothetical protein
MLCAGDFNESHHADEQFGGKGRSERQMEGFRDAVEACGLTNLGYIGLTYSWMIGTMAVPMSKSAWIEALLQHVSLICLPMSKFDTYKLLNPITFVWYSSVRGK